MCINFLKEGYIGILPCLFQLELGRRWKYVGENLSLGPDEFFFVIGKLRADTKQWKHGCIRESSLAKRSSMFIPCKTLYFAYIPLEIEKETATIFRLKRTQVWLTSQSCFYKLSHEESAQVYFNNFLKEVERNVYI